jgi:hypothetical protein
MKSFYISILLSLQQTYINLCYSQMSFSFNKSINLDERWHIFIIQNSILSINQLSVIHSINSMGNGALGCVVVVMIYLDVRYRIIYIYNIHRYLVIYVGCYAYWCWCCFLYSLTGKINEPRISCCCVPNALGFYRMKVRSILKIKVKPSP